MKTCRILNRKYKIRTKINICTICSSYSVIVRVSAVLKRTVAGDRRLDNPSGSHPQSQVNSVCQSMMLEVWSVERDWSV